MENKGSLSALGILLGVSIIVTGLIVSNAFIRIKKMDNVLSVSGSARKEVTSDSARLTGSFSRTVTYDQLKSAYVQMKNDEKIVKDYFTEKGFADADIAPVYMGEVYNYKTEQLGGPKQYMLTQNVQIRSNDVNKIKELAQTNELISKGVFFSANPVEYYYTNLPQLRIDLLPDAIGDAKKRAEAIAKSSGRSVDVLKTVSMGVVQVMPVGTVDVSDYGSYDTSQIQKEVMITVKTSFSLK